MRREAPVLRPPGVMEHLFRCSRNPPGDPQRTLGMIVRKRTSPTAGTSPRGPPIRLAARLPPTSSSETLLGSEQPYYTAKTHLHTFVLPNAGHDINLAPNTATYRRAVLDWANELVGTG